MLRIKDNSKDYLIDLGADFNLYSFFDFVYVDTQPKSNELMGEWIWANADTPNIYDKMCIRDRFTHKHKKSPKGDFIFEARKEVRTCLLIA